MALYRKYRSSNFDAVVGQQHVVETLKTAITKDRLSHAYLFTGPRGVGKTSVARLLARAANCTDAQAEKRPCNTCDNCKIEIGAHLDLIEIDAASNRGIDDARALREKISQAPSLGRYKVYIIDEVHMLTTEAFNALLKTLEEPPPHAIFILATTEAHKLPETIISRTQRFSFRPIGASAIVAHLKGIAAKEQVSISDEALEVIATSSRGGFRDAISLLDQAASSGEPSLEADHIRNLLGHSDPKTINVIITTVSNGDTNGLLEALTSAWETGVQAGQLALQLIEAWRTSLRDAVRNGDAATIAAGVAAIEALMPVLRSPWPELSLEAALTGLASGVVTTTTAKSGALVPTQASTRVEQLATPVATKAPVAPTSDQAEAALPPGVQPSGDLWLKALTQIKQKNNSLYALLRSSCSTNFEGDQLTLGCRFSFHRDRLKEEKNLKVIEQAMARVYGRKYKVVPQLETKAAAPVASAAAEPSSELMNSALEILGGEVIA